MIKIFYALFKEIVSNPIYVTVFALGILSSIFYKKFRGYMGEFWVKNALNKLPKNEYIVMDDVMIESNGTHQIDHIVISKFGIFVIEMKNYYGMMVGKEYNDKWIQYLGKNKYYFKNPIHQNYGHIKSLSEVLNIDESLFISIICISNQAKLRVETNSNVVQLDNLIRLIKSYQNSIVNINIDDIAYRLNALNIIDRKQRREHVTNIKQKIKADNDKADNMICPKCGENLVVRNGQYGQFIGCSNFPNCRYIKK